MRMKTVCFSNSIKVYDILGFGFATISIFHLLCLPSVREEKSKNTNGMNNEHCVDSQPKTTCR